MKYTRAHIDAIGYELAPVVVTSEELEERLRPLYDALRMVPGQLEALTGIAERRWWEPEPSLAGAAAAAGQRALAQAGVRGEDVEMVVYGGVCREHFEPATACHVAHRIGVNPAAAIHDISNACLGVMDGIIEVANRIELGQIRAGLVVAAETAREIVEVTIRQLLLRREMELFTRSLATLTGGSGAIGVLLTDGSFGGGQHRLLGGMQRAAPEFHHLCRWGLDGSPILHRMESLPQGATTDSVAVLKHGVDLGLRTWERFLAELDWGVDDIDRIVCHQVGGAHRDSILKTIGMPGEKDFSTFSHLGNIGTVSLPLSAALAEERGFLEPGQRVGFLGIGSGLNCLMLGLEW